MLHAPKIDLERAKSNWHNSLIASRKLLKTIASIEQSISQEELEQLANEKQTDDAWTYKSTDDMLAELNKEI